LASCIDRLWIFRWAEIPSKVQAAKYDHGIQDNPQGGNVMISTRIFKTFMLVSGVAGLLAGGAGLCISAELRQFEPFTAPNKMESAPSNEYRQQQPPTVPDSFYRDFAAKVRKSNPDERKKATELFTEKRNKALAGNRLQDAGHYQKLLDILAKP
jgi:hypothetical protein